MPSVPAVRRVRTDPRRNGADSRFPQLSLPSRARGRDATIEPLHFETVDRCPPDDPRRRTVVAEAARAGGEVWAEAGAKVSTERIARGALPIGEIQD